MQFCRVFDRLDLKSSDLGRVRRQGGEKMPRLQGVSVGLSRHRTPLWARGCAHKTPAGENRRGHGFLSGESAAYAAGLSSPLTPRLERSAGLLGLADVDPGRLDLP